MKLASTTIVYISMFFEAVLRTYPSVLPSSSSKRHQKAVQDLITRILGTDNSQLFYVQIIPLDPRNKSFDSFALQKINHTIFITGTSGVAAAYGFHYYLKYYCDSHISWDNDQLEIPSVLPQVNLTKNSFDTYRYYQNVCIYSYSYVWWTWERWEREIDWIALNGFNLALAFTGLEAVWFMVFKQLNLTDTEINEHFTGSGFLAWNRMANIRGWGGPLSQSWMEEQKVLQRKILTRMKDLGIIPVLPGFCGHVPRGVKRLYPDARMTEIPPWVRFSGQYCCPFLLDPDEILFEKIGTLFYKMLEKEFGTSYFYNCDIFNEIRPPSDNLMYLRNTSAAVLRVLTKSNKNAIWIMQNWLFVNDVEFWSVDKVQHFLSGVPNEKLIILDLQSDMRPMYDTFHSYFGKSFIWCMLHNFGGTLGMHGSMDVINHNVLKSRTTINSTMIGTGITPEGINQNYVIYDFMTESSWRNETVNISQWIEKYSTRRYGGMDSNLQFVWKLLKTSVYDYKLMYPLHGQYTFVLRPSLGHQPWTWYNISDVTKAWDLILNVKNENVLNNPNYQHDLVDLTRQVFQNLFDKYYKKLVDNFYQADVTNLIKNSHLLLELLYDINSILATNEHFLLSSWLEAAKNMSNSTTEKRILEMNARNQITLWGPNGEIRDYAIKQWAGVVSDYCLPRWNLFFTYLVDSLEKGVPFKQHMFDLEVFKSIELPFTYSSKQYSKSPVGDTNAVAKALYFKWRHALFL